jgi:ribosomal protein S11
VSSAGAQGFKGSRKSTPFRRPVAAQEACKKAQEVGLKSAFAYIKALAAARVGPQGGERERHPHHRIQTSRLST